VVPLALQVETGELPLDLRRRQQELKYAVNVKATDGHPAKSITEFHWTSLSKKFNLDNLPIHCSSSDYVSRRRRDRSLQRRFPIVDILFRSGDIRDRSAKSSEIAPKKACFSAPIVFFGESTPKF